MAIIVEDGTGVADAVSYVTVADARSFAEMRGISLPIADSAVEALLVTGADYIEMYAARFTGKVAHTDQGLSWPRTGAYANGEKLSDDAVPSAITKAQLHLTLYAIDGALVTNTNGAKFVKRKKIAVLETEYSEQALLSMGAQTTYPVVDALLEPLLGGGAGAPLRSYRI